MWWEVLRRSAGLRGRRLGRVDCRTRPAGPRGLFTEWVLVTVALDTTLVQRENCFQKTQCGARIGFCERTKLEPEMGLDRVCGGDVDRF